MSNKDDKFFFHRRWYDASKVAKALGMKYDDDHEEMKETLVDYLHEDPGNFKKLLEILDE